jgi:hypothetical protein
LFWLIHAAKISTAKLLGKKLCLSTDEDNGIGLLVQEFDT